MLFAKPRMINFVWRFNETLCASYYLLNNTFIHYVSGKLILLSASEWKGNKDRKCCFRRTIFFFNFLPYFIQSKKIKISNTNYKNHIVLTWNLKFTNNYANRLIIAGVLCRRCNPVLIGGYISGWLRLLRLVWHPALYLGVRIDLTDNCSGSSRYVQGCADLYCQKCSSKPD